MKTLALIVSLSLGGLAHAGETAKPDAVPPAPPTVCVRAVAIPVMSACRGRACSVRSVSRRVVTRTLYRSRVSVRRWRLCR